MSYESAILLFIIFLIPAGIFLVTNIMRLRQHEKEEQAELDLIISSHKKQGDSSHYYQRLWLEQKDKLK